MESEADPLKFSIVLPTKQLPPALAHITTTPAPQFLVGYRNILYRTETGIEWGLTKNSSFCGRAFVYEITEAEAHHIQQIKRQGEFIEMVGNNYILLINHKEVKPATESITSEQLAQLLQLVDGKNQIGLNLVKSSFDSFNDFQQVVGKAAESLNCLQKLKDLSVEERVKMEFNAKHLSGQGLLQLPVVSKQTGNRVEGQFIALKNA